MSRRALFAAAVLAALNVAPAAHAADAVPGEVLVRFKGNAGGSERADARRAARVDVKRALRLEHTQLVRTEPGQSVGRAIAALERHGSVLRAAPNWIARASLSPDDVHYIAGSLWGLHNPGQLIDGKLLGVDADIDAPEAWDVHRDASGVVVAVVDTGVRYDHPDLDGNIWSNPGETLNGLDDGDPGAKADDVRGWDFVDEDNDPTDLADHGTHVAGTIAAEGNNATGVTGVAWDAQIMPVRVLDEDGLGTGARILEGLDYAGDMGADVVNASLGGNAPPAAAPFYAEAMNHPATLYVVAAGNETNDNDGGADEQHRYPCNTPIANLVCVAATDRQDALAGFSNWGATSVDLAAPGVAILSTYPKVAQTGFSDDFESGLTGWTTAGSTGGSWGDFEYTQTPKPYPSAFLHESPAGGDYSFANNENLVITTAGSHDLTGKKGCVLAYDIYYEYDVEDELLVEVSTNGTTWTKRDAYTGTNGGVGRELTNLHADGQPAVRFRFRTVADDTVGDPGESGWFGSLIDNVHVTCQATPDLSSYDYMQGTSMASPHVAGVATLLFGARPDADVSQVRGWLLTSGDPLSALAGKTATGRRLNANAALLAATGLAGGPEAITDAATSITETSATLKGRIDPNGTATSYQFRYGTSPGALDARVPASPASAGAGTAAVPVQQTISGLSPGQTYHFQLVAIQGGTETAGVVQSFKPAQKTPPTVTIAPALDVTTTGAVLSGAVNPNGKATDVLLEWGTASGVYPSQTETLALGDGTQTIELSVELSELRPGTKYFYRLRAFSADGEAASPEQSFTTAGVAPGGTLTPAPPGIQTGTPPLPTDPAMPPGPPPSPSISVICKRTKAGKVGCKAGATAAARVTVRIFRGTRVVSRGSAATLTKGRALRMKTPRRVARGRYRLQITVTRDGMIVTTVTKRIRL